MDEEYQVKMLALVALLLEAKVKAKEIYDFEVQVLEAMAVLDEGAKDND